MLTQKEQRSAKAIEQAIAREQWLRARRLIRVALSRKGDDHWLLSRLALTYYEQRQYRRALNYELKALQIEPYCPLAILSSGDLGLRWRTPHAGETQRSPGNLSMAHK